MNQKEFRVEKVIKRNNDKLYVEWKGCDSSFNSWIDKKDIVWKSEYFPKPRTLEGGKEGRGGDVKVELDLSNYPTKINLRNVSGVHTSKFVKKIDLDSLKSEIN